MSSSVSYGAETWAKTYVSPYFQSAYSVQQTSDGGYVVAGTSGSEYALEPDGRVLKLDSSGSVEWQKTFDGTQFEVLHSVQQTSDGGYIVAGANEYDSYGYRSGIWVIKLSSVGAVQWQKTFDGISTDWAYSVQQTSDDGYIVAGYSYYSSEAGADDIWILKLDSSGNVQWEKTYGGTDQDRANSVQQTSDGGYIVAGYSNSYSNPYRSTGYNGWVLKLDGSGSVEWQKAYVGDPYPYDRLDGDWAYSVQQTSDGGYVVAGYTYSYGVGHEDGWILKLDSSGNVEWQKTYGGKRYDYLYSIQQTGDGGYIAAGKTFSFVADESNFWVLKLDSSGNIPDCDIIGTSDASIVETTAIGISNNITGNNSSATIHNALILPEDIEGIVIETCFVDDRDGDTIPDDEDNCPEIPNGLYLGTCYTWSEMASGTTCDNDGVCEGDAVCNMNQEDTDGDGIGDVCDNCPDDSNPNQADGDCDGTGDVCDGTMDCSEGTDCDSDCDGVYNQDDNCQFDYNPGQEDTFPLLGNDIGDACDCEGNFDCDDDCDGSDAFTFKVDFGRSAFGNPCEGGDPCNGDFDCDGDCDGKDAALFKQDFGRSAFQDSCPTCEVGEWCVEYEHTCLTNFDCPLDSYCEKAIGFCDIVGECIERPGSCRFYTFHVCGCDGITYLNDCFAAKARISIDYLDPCM